MRNQLKYYIDGINFGNKIILSQAITLIESTLDTDKVLSQKLIESVSVKNETIRLGITGVPGVGKSSFIEVLGSDLIEKGHKVAVLAIDSSSQKTGGSILGDKTRMETLSKNPCAYIRPSPAKKTLGGVGENTRETIMLCEVAGYDIIIIETVGVGQSETVVHGMVDFFLLLMLAGAGDELQGIKRGIMEMADGIVINKADGENINNVNKAKNEYRNALNLFVPNNTTGWQPKVLSCSALEKTGISEIWDMIEEFKEKIVLNEYFENNRLRQNVNWFNQQLNLSIINKVLVNPEIIEYKLELISKIEKGKISSKYALNLMMERIFN